MLFRDLRQPEFAYGKVQLDDSQQGFDFCQVRFNQSQPGEVFVAANTTLSLYHSNQGSGHNLISSHEFPTTILNIQQDADVLLVACEDGSLHAFDWAHGQISDSYSQLGKVRLSAGSWNKGKSLVYVKRDESLALISKQV